MSLWLPCLNEIKKSRKAVLIGIPFAAFFMSAMTVAAIAFYGPDQVPTITFPILSMSRYILIGNFLKGFEAIFMIVWLSTQYYQIQVFFYPAVVGLAQWFGMKDHKPLVIPMTITVVILSIIPPNLFVTLKYDDFIDLFIVLPLGLFIPVLLLIAVIRKKKEVDVHK